VCSGHLRASLNCGAALFDVRRHYFFPLPLRFKNEFHAVAQRAVAAGVGSDVVRFFLYLGACVFHGDGQSSGAHCRDIDDVVAYEGGFFQFDSCFLDDFLESGLLVLNSLAHVFKLQVSGTKGNGFGDALGDQSRLNAGHASKRDGSAVVSVEAFGFDEGLALESESALAAMLSGLFEYALWRPCRGGEDEKLAVGENAVDVEEEESDFTGAGLGREFGHRREF